MQYLPSSVLLGAVQGPEYLYEAEQGNPAFWAGEVYKTKKFFEAFSCTANCLQVPTSHVD